MPTTEEESGAIVQIVEAPVDASGLGPGVELEPSHFMAEPCTGVDAGPLWIVGFGASAGGLDALTALFGRLPQLTRMACVVVQHLLPGGKSFLPQLLGRVSKASVVDAEDGVRPRRGVVYVAPPDVVVTCRDGRLRLAPSAGHEGAPINAFFSTLAEDSGRRAIGVLLSGAGSDGVTGLRAIKEAGGTSFVQEPKSARYTGMPRSALQAGAAEFCLAPEAIADELALLDRAPHRSQVSKPPSQHDEGTSKLLGLIKSTFGTDLAYYKAGTIERRLARRLALHRIDRVEDYLRFAISQPDELRQMYKDVLIGVTRFFRDPRAFEALGEKVLPRIIEQKERSGEAIRVWVPACSTGEEAYSIAICLREFLGERAEGVRVRIFASDVDEDSVQHGRRGVYSEAAVEGISAARLARFFVRKDDGYHVERSIREMVVFSTQDVMSDAPFVRLDLVSCRNLLIYLQPPMQRKVLRVLHHALRPGAFLMLGTSETVGDSPDLFSLVDRENKLYVSKHWTFRELEAPPRSDPEALGAARGIVPRSARAASELADQKVLELYGPPGVLIDEHYEIRHFRGRTGPYLAPLPGAASLNVLRLSRPDLHADLRRTIQRAFDEGTRVVTDCAQGDGAPGSFLRVEALPIADVAGGERYLLVLFHEIDARGRNEPLHGEGQPAEDRTKIEQLERELTLAKAELQATLVELGELNEALRAANQELQASSEELDTANDELRSSRDELLSTHQELSLVNAELERRASAQQEALDDFYTIAAGIESALLIADVDLSLRRFSYAAERLFGLTAQDIGQALGKIEGFFEDLGIDQLCAAVLETSTPVTRDARGKDQRWYSLRVGPYRTLEQAVAGTVLVFTGRDAASLPPSSPSHDVIARAGAFLEVVDQPFSIVDARLSVVWANRAYREYFRDRDASGVRESQARAGWKPRAERGLAELVAATIASGGAFRDYRLEFGAAEHGSRSVLVSGSRVPGAGRESPFVLLSFTEDVA